MAKKQETPEPAKGIGEKVANVVGSVGTVLGLPPVNSDPVDDHDSGPDETASNNPDGHPTRKRQSDLGSG